MKRIEAIIRPFQVDEVKGALDHLGVPGLTVVEVQGIAAGPARRGPRDDADHSFECLPNLKIEVLLDDARVAEVLETIASITRTNPTDDPRPVCISPVDDVVRIRTGERGAAAV